MSRFSNWSNEKLAAQMIFPRLNCDDYLSNSEYSTDIKNTVKKGVGGFCIFQGNTATVSNITSELQAIAEIPLLFCADFENGITMRLEDGTAFPHAMAMGKTGDYIKKISTSIANESKDLGVLWNLAPVCDINSNPDNPVINIRSFGETADLVSKSIVDYISATQKENILSCAKHFPGHGNTKTDSHIEFPVVNKSIDELEQMELKPFVAAISVGVKSIMLGHLIVPSIDKNYPASLSKKTVEFLRNKLNYNGIILTDALDMSSIFKKFSLVEIIELAFNAGNDIIFMPENPVLAIDVLSNYIKNNSELKNQVYNSINRIYNAKRWAGLIPFYSKNISKTKVFLEHPKLALRAALQAVEVIDTCSNSELNASDSYNKYNKLLPIPDDELFAAFSILQKAEDLQAATRFYTMLGQATSEQECDYAYLDENITEEEILEMQKSVSDAKFIIFAFFYKGRGYSNSLSNTSKLNNIMNKIANGKNIISIFFGDPYMAKSICGDKIKILAYSDSFPSLAAVVMKLTGRSLPDTY